MEKGQVKALKQKDPYAEYVFPRQESRQVRELAWHVDDDLQDSIVRDDLAAGDGRQGTPHGK